MTGAGPTIRAAEPADAGAVIALWEACGLTRPWNDPQTDFDLALKTVTSTILVAERGGLAVGSVMVGFDGHRGWAYYLAVDPGTRRRGLARALMQSAEAWLVLHDAPKIQLMVRAGNSDALAFYEALGLEVQPVIVLGRRLDGGSG